MLGIFIKFQGKEDVPVFFGAVLLVLCREHLETCHIPTKLKLVLICRKRVESGRRFGGEGLDDRDLLQRS